MKKIFSAIISSPLKGRLGGVLFALLATTTLWAYDFQSGDLYYNITSSSAPYTVEVTSKTSSYPYNDGVTFTTITIPKTVSYGGITYSVTSIGDYAFNSCESLTSITIPNSVTSIGESAFSYCSSLTSVTPDNSVTSIGSSAFYGCSSLTSITIPNGVTSIGGKAFYECSSLTSITIPNSVTSIGACTFESCSSLSSITIPNSVTSIGDRAFRKCSSLTSITIPNSVTSVGGAVFHSCSALKSVVLSENITSLETITISSGKGFGWYGFFEDCSSLTSITIPKNMEFMDDDTFDDCSSLKSIVWNAKNCKSSIFDDSYVSSQITSFVIGKDVEHIPAGLCQGMKLIPSITIPSGVKNIGNRAFYGCSSLVTMVVESDNIVYDSRNHCNAIVETATNKLIAGCQNTIIPNSVTSIGSSAFEHCSSLTSITIPNSVTSIGEYAFSSCYSLTSVTLPNSVSSIGYSAFEDCSSLTSITIPNSVTSIGDRAFRKCSSLTSITIPNGVTSIGASTFESCSSLSSITIPNSVTSIGSSAFYGCSSLTSVTIPNGVTSIGNRAFYDCSSLTSVTLGNSVTSIGEYAFSYCSSLTSMTIPNSVTSIGRSAFYACESLISVFLEPNTPPTLGKNNFTASTICYIPCGTLSAYESSTWEEIVGRFVEQCGDSSTLNKCGNDLYWEYRNSTLAITGTGDMYDYTVDSSAPWHNFSEQIKCITIGNCVTSIGNYAFCDCSSLDSISVYAITPPKFGNSGNLLTSSPTCYIPCGTLAAYQSSSWAEQVGSFVEQCNEPVKCGDNLYWTYANGTLTITGTGTMYNYDDMDNLAPWNSIRNNIKNIVLPEGLTSIGDWAFYLCSYVTSISIPEEVTNIGDRAFQYCNSLTSVIWNAENCDDYWGAESYRPFYDCSQITSFTFGDSVKHIPAHLCYEMSSLTSVNMGNSVTSIGYKAFSHCSSLSSITIPNSITNIGEKAFLGCSDLASVIWNAENCDDFSWSEIRPFYDCFQITSFTFGDSVKHIPTYLCYEMSTLTSISIPNSVTSIGGGAFYNCSSLDSVVVEAITPPTLGDAGNYSFFSSPTCYIPCGTLAAYQSSSWAEQVGSFVEQCDEPVVDANKCGDNLYWAYTDGTLTITGTGDMYNYDYMDNLAPWNSVSNNIKNIVLPEGLTSIGEWAFYLCASVTSISIPEGVSSIGVRAFCNCSSLTSISIPNSVTSIGERAFYSCYNLASVTLSTNLSKIDKYLFGQCRALAAITIPNNVTAIENGAFSGCSSLDSVSIEATTPPVLSGSSTFSSSPTCYIPCGTLAAYQSSSWAEQVGGFVEQCDDNDNNQSLISVTDGALSDWDKLPMEYLFETKCVEGASWDALKSVKVYADLTYINLVVEWDTDIVTDLSSVPFHVYLNVDNDAPTGGFGEQWVKPNIDLLLEGYFYLDGNPCAYQPDVALYAGTPLANEWAWDWTTIEALAASQLITKGVMEIQIEYGKLPVKLENTFTVGFDIQQSWNSVGVLPNAADDEVGNMILAEKMLVRINNVNAPTSIENTHSPSSITNTHKLLRNGQLIILHDGKTYTVMGAEIK